MNDNAKRAIYMCTYLSYRVLMLLPPYQTYSSTHSLSIATDGSSKTYSLSLELPFLINSIGTIVYSSGNNYPHDLQNHGNVLVLCRTWNMLQFHTVWVHKKHNLRLLLHFVLFLILEALQTVCKEAQNAIPYMQVVMVML